MPNTAERRCVGSEITQKQNKYEQADPEVTYGLDEDTSSPILSTNTGQLVFFWGGPFFGL
jgi:hypothetical protein